MLFAFEFPLQRQNVISSREYSSLHSRKASYVLASLTVLWLIYCNVFDKWLASGISVDVGERRVAVKNEERRDACPITWPYIRPAGGAVLMRVKSTSKR